MKEATDARCNKRDNGTEDFHFFLSYTYIPYYPSPPPRCIHIYFYYFILKEKKIPLSQFPVNYYDNLTHNYRT